jgi:hypothetical protein
VNSNYRDTSSLAALRATTLYVILTSIFGLWLAYDAAFVRLVTYAPWADYWEHTALFTEWVGNFSAPSNPHVDDPSLSPRYMPLFWALSFLGVIFELNAIELMSISAVLNYSLIVTGLYFFLKAYFRDPWAPVIGFIAIFMFWGVSWNWSNLFHLRSFFYVAGFPSTFVFGLSLISFSLVLRLLRREGSVFFMVALLGILASLMFLCHPLTAVFGISGCALLALTNTSESIGLRLIILLALAAGMIFAELWPYFSVWKVSLGLYGAGTEQWFTAAESVGPMQRLQSGVWKHIFYNPGLVLTILGPALIGLPICIWLFMRREHWFIVLGAACMAVPYLLHPFIAVPLAHRFLLFVVIYFHLAITWGGLQVIEAWNSRPRPAYAASLLWGVVSLVSIMLVANIVLLSMEFRGYTLSPKTLEVMDKRAALPEGMSVVDLYTELTKPLSEEAIVLATPVVGWPLPTVKAKVISVFHENPMLLDQQKRYVVTTDFFEKPQNESQRSAVVRDYKVTHLLLKGEPETKELDSWLNLHAVQVSSAGSYRMYKLLNSAAAAAPPPEPKQLEEPVAVEPIIMPSATVQTVNPLPVSAPPTKQAEPTVAKSKPKQPAQPAPARSGNPSVGAYGAPIAEPLIPPPGSTLKDDSTYEQESESAKEVTDQSDDVLPAKEPEAEVYGAPIPAPVLDPKRHGG